MYVSSSNAAELLLPLVLWGGDGTVTHTDGNIEILRNVRVTPASQSASGTKEARGGKPNFREKVKRHKAQEGKDGKTANGGCR